MLVFDVAEEIELKLGIAYNAFDGIEHLEYAIGAIRDEVDYVCIIRQEMSYHGNPADPEDLELVDWIGKTLADEVIDYKPDLKLTPHINETTIRNLGRLHSSANGCTHHISADVDEYYVSDQLRFAKQAMEGFDWSMVPQHEYYKHHTYQVSPPKFYKVSFIGRVEIAYGNNESFPYKIDITRRPVNAEKIRVFTTEECVIHHMNYVRNNLLKKTANNLNHRQGIGHKKLFKNHATYVLGEVFFTPPDYLNRRTIEVPNLFNIKEINGRIISNRS